MALLWAPCLYLRLEKYKLLISVVILDVVLRLDILLRLGRFEKSDDSGNILQHVKKRMDEADNIVDKDLAQVYS